VRPLFDGKISAFALPLVRRLASRKPAADRQIIQLKNFAHVEPISTGGPVEQSGQWPEISSSVESNLDVDNIHSNNATIEWPIKAGLHKQPLPLGESGRVWVGTGSWLAGLQPGHPPKSWGDMLPKF
jgi:predicted NUDIX family NTP pyrophosphohydrolase